MVSIRIMVRQPMKFSLRAITNFVAVVDAGSLNRAAQSLHVAQPWLSRQIQRLEADIGLQLIERGHTSLRLTPAGEALLPAMRHFAKTLENVESEGVFATTGQASPIVHHDAPAQGE